MSLLPLLLAACLLGAAFGRDLRQASVSTSVSTSVTSVTGSSTGTAPLPPLVPGATIESIQPAPLPAVSLPLLPSVKWPAAFTPLTWPNSHSTPTATPITAPVTPTTTSPTGSSPSVPSPSGGSCPDAQRALDMHNAARKLRGAAPLAWHTGQAADSLAWSSACRFQHSHTSGLGENLYISSADSSCANAVKMWLDEASLYRGDYSEAVGHWTQIVWKGTTAVGCGLARCGRGVMVTCRYTPAGNVLGRFAGNV